MRFVDSLGKDTEIYPLNPNGSPEGITGITAGDGRITIMMPHPERVFRKHQLSWYKKDWKEFSPWMQIFINANNFVKQLPEFDIFFSKNKIILFEIFKIIFKSFFNCWESNFIT